MAQLIWGDYNKMKLKSMNYYLQYLNLHSFNTKNNEIIVYNNNNIITYSKILGDTTKSRTRVKVIEMNYALS